MSLSSSLFTGTSGLKNMGNALQVTGNNIANLNTIGFKRGRATFADTLYETVATQGGTDQMGKGMAVGAVSQNFSQGSFESTGNATDLSIGGDGFFIMRQSNAPNTVYTRAGNFIFNKDGQLVNPEGYVVQGWDLDDETGDDVGAIKDLVLKAFTNPPRKSSMVTAVTNLNADSASKSVVLSNNWDSSKETYMSANNFEYQTVLKAYDALGSTHDVTIFYDKKSGTEWEYVVTCNPEEDKRNGVQGTDSKGLLARGTITFSQSSGQILDFTMSEFTGRLGNFKANGVNTTQNVEYHIINYDQMPLDGYGFNFQFDGSAWNFVDVNRDGIIQTNEKPLNYGNATIVYSDSQEIHLVLNQTSLAQIDPDLKIKLARAAVPTDTLGFDINDKSKLHTLGIEGTRYFGGTASDNTTQEINDPTVMTHDSKGLGLIWNPDVEGMGKWYWSNPQVANSAGTLVSGITIDGALPVASSATIHNAENLSMYAEGIKLRYGANNTWDWNDLLKIEDFATTHTFEPTNKPSLSVVTQGSQGAIATTLPVPLYWLGTGWSLASPPAAPLLTDTIGNTTITIDPALSSAVNVVFDMHVADLAGASTVKYTFGSPLTNVPGRSITFGIDPTPPRVYSSAGLTNMIDPLDQTFQIDFDGDNIPDITFDPAVGAGAPISPGGLFEFNVDPDVPPAEYANATLKGDQNAVAIDLDGSGNDKDLRFVFDTPLKQGVTNNAYRDRSEIDFDILGSTAWTQIEKSEIAESGYFSFTTDFLGGEFGSTENAIKLNLGTRFTGTNFENDSLSTTQYSKASSTVFQNADGYAAGALQGVDVASDGILTGVYSSGQVIPLFRIGLAKFLNNYGLFNLGGNLFKETRDSGNAITNKPGENGLGSLAPNSLEMSNVDISEEFVALITNQRGFQANSKTITTIDDMMQTVIQMKR